MPPQTQTRTILIKVDTSASKGLADIASQMGLLNKNTKSLAGNMGFLTSAFKSWLGYLGIKQLTDMSDQMQQLYGQLILITGSTQGATVALQGIAAVADRTNQAVAGTGQAFVRYDQILKPAGASTQEILALVETLTNSLRTSRVPTDGITESLLTLSQAFIKGAVTGRELRTILTQNVTVANLLKQTYGGDIYKKAEDGVISITGVMKILAANQAKINSDAQTLAPTFGQTLTKAFNDVTVAVGNLNQQYALSTKFASIVGIASQNLAGILTVLGGIITVVAIAKIPDLIAAMRAARIAFVAFAAANPVLLILTAIATIGSLIYEYWSKIGPMFTSVRAAFLEMASDMEERGLGIRQALADATGNKGLQTQIDITKSNIADMRAGAAQLREELANATPSVKSSPAEDMQKALDSLTKKIANMPQPTQKLKTQLGDLNKELLNGTITLDQYNEKIDTFDLYKLNREFSEGKFDILQYNKTLEGIQIEKFNREFTQGKITLEQFNKGTAAANLAVLNEELALGKISIDAYAASIIKLRDQFRPGAAFYSGISTFIEQAGTLSSGIAKVTTQAFDHLSDTLTSFIQTGKLDFASFTKAILDDLTAMLVKAAIVAPIAQGILGAIGIGVVAPSAAGAAAGGGGAGGIASSMTLSAMGNVMTDQGPLTLNKYANGGIANSPQLSIFGEGRKPEAYVPLPDGRNIPVKMQGNGGGVSVTQTIVIGGEGTITGNSKTVGQNAKQLGDLMRKIAVDTIVQQKRKGGVLS